MDRMDISQKLSAEARKDRIALIIGASVMTLLLFFSVSVSDFIDHGVLSKLILLLTKAALMGVSVFLVLRLTNRIKNNSLSAGMHIVIESVPMVCALMDREHNLVYCNEETPKVYGLDDREAYYGGFDSVTLKSQPDGSDSYSKMGEHVAAALQDGSKSFRWWRQTAKGEPLPLEVTLIRVFFNGSNHLLEFSKDLRKDMLVQKQENVMKERMQVLLDTSPLLCTVYNEQGVPIEVNREVEKLLGINDRKRFLSDIGEFLPQYQPDGTASSQRKDELLADVMQNGFKRYELMYRHTNGTPIPMDEISHCVVLDGTKQVISYSRDLRDYYREKEKDRAMQQKIQYMMEQQDGYVREQVQSINDSADAIRRMISSIQSVNKTLQHSNESVKGLEEASVMGHSSLSTVVSDIQEIARESKSLLEINSVMQSIASQTNLLSMNAAIEAAHAGESGRGFAVVADEIRKLAESSSAQSKTIGAVLKKIAGSIDKITKSTDNVLGKFGAIDDGVKAVAEQEGNILSAMQEQSNGSEQVLRSMGAVNEVTNRVKENARRMVESSKEIVLQSKSSLQDEPESFTDAITNARSRQYFSENAERELRDCLSSNRDFSLIMLGLKRFEDGGTVGGEESDVEILKILVARTRNTFKQGTLLARFEAGRFVVTLPGVSRMTALKLANQIRTKIESSPFRLVGDTVAVAATVALASQENGSTLQELVEHASGELDSQRTQM